MRLTTRGRYAVTAMLDLALHADSGPVALADIAARQDISLAYLEQLFAKLRKGGLVASVRGPGGGYSLALAPSETSVASVIAAVDESVDATRCGGARNCHGEVRCLTHDLWEDLSNAIGQFLAAISLADLIERRACEHAPSGPSVVHLVPRAGGRTITESRPKEAQGAES
jgi:Rrf2 family transcriptional regulator, iron-sulfur cluster assembly transcription factor